MEGTNRPSFQWRGVCLDCADAEEMATFYGALFGWVVTARDTPDDRLGGSGWIVMRDPGGGPTISFQAEEWYEPPVWPEVPGAPTKMMHFEVAVENLEVAVAFAIEDGAREASPQPADRDRSELRVMLDPAGHPFCLFTT
jgi:catechol 2,3-dioxygenase-like lactoylglutathione lyase family enzyme